MLYSIYHFGHTSSPSAPGRAQSCHRWTKSFEPVIFAQAIHSPARARLSVHSLLLLLLSLYVPLAKVFYAVTLTLDYRKLRIICHRIMTEFYPTTDPVRVRCLSILTYCHVMSFDTHCTVVLSSHSAAIAVDTPYRDVGVHELILFNIYRIKR